MSITIDTTVDIDASKQAVWGVLTDFAAYGEWNPSLRIEGTAKVGTKLVVHMSGGGEHGMSFRPKVLVATPCEELRWLGKLGFRGIVDGEHFFILTTNEDGTTHLEHGERFSGALVALARGEERHRIRGLQPGPQAARRKLALPAMTSSSRTSQARQTVAPSGQPVVTTAASQRRLANPGVARCRGRPLSGCRSRRSYTEFL
jgi:hypothetical protein